MLYVSAIREELGAMPGEPLGVGPVVAAIRMATLLERLKPSAVCFVGTAGSYAQGPEVGTVIASRRVGLSPSVAVMGLGYVPRPPRPVECDRGLLDRLDVPRADVLTVSAITTDPTLMGRLADGWQVEHMEAYGAGLACHKAEVPFVSVLGIANRVGPDAHRQWLENQQVAQDAARAVAAQLTA